MCERRSYRLPEPAGGRIGEGRAPAGSSAGRSTRVSCSAVVRAVNGVEFVKILRVYETDLETGQQEAKPAGPHLLLETDELIASGQHIVKAEHREVGVAAPPRSGEELPLGAPNGRLEPPRAPAGGISPRVPALGLPSIYHSPGSGRPGSARFGIDFVAALEQVLDPSWSSCSTASPPTSIPTWPRSRWSTRWPPGSGSDPDERLPEEPRRELVRRGAELARRSGTRAGLELALHVVFPDLPLAGRGRRRCGVATAGR